MSAMHLKRSLNPHKIDLVSIILPTYNEAGNIADLIIAIDESVLHPHEIIVVDDNSPDGTSAIVRELIEQGSPWVRLETRTSDRGLRKSISRGIELSHGDAVVWMDCDFSMPPSVIPSLLEKIEEGFDISIASRFVPGGSHKKGATIRGREESVTAIFLSHIINFILRLTLGTDIHDYTSGFIAVRREVLRRIPLHGDYGEYFMDLVYRARIEKYTFAEVPYICEPRRSGESKTVSSFRVFLKRLCQYGWMLLRLWGFHVQFLFGYVRRGTGEEVNSKD